MPEERVAGKRGYLLEGFRLFHLKDARPPRVEYHYHEFDKLTLILSGKITYEVEGVTYFLQPWDVLAVQHNLIHRLAVDPSEPYERIVLWLGRGWLDAHSTADTPLDECFTLTRQRNFHLLRIPPARRLVYMQTLQELERALRSEEFGHALLSDVFCQQLLILLARDVRQDRAARDLTDSYRLDPKMEEVLRYIAANLDGDLNVEALAGHFYLSRYYLMHRFKAVTGYSLHQYIAQKRLLRAGELIRSGVPVMKASEQSGFREYSTFLRAFQNTFHVSPRKFQTGEKEERGHGIADFPDID